jgi:hypothetical protein
VAPERGYPEGEHRRHGEVTEGESNRIQTVSTLDQVVDLTLAKKIVQQLGAVKFPY